MPSSAVRRASLGITVSEPTIGSVAQVYTAPPKGSNVVPKAVPNAVPNTRDGLGIRHPSTLPSHLVLGGRKTRSKKRKQRKSRRSLRK